MSRILVVDDAAFMRMMLKDILLENGYEVCGEAGDGEQALEKYKELKPDLVTMDLTMPNCDGMEGLKKIMSYDSKARVIMCSAMGQQPIVIDAFQTGALDFIVKPFKPDRILETVIKALGK